MKESKKNKEIDVAIKPEEQYLEILNSLNDPMHVVDKDLKITFQNPAMVLWLNKLNLNSDIVDKTIFEVLPFLEYDNIHNEYNKVFKTGELLNTTEATKLNNRNIFTEILKIPVKSNGKVEQVITIMRDITEQKEAEEKYSHLFLSSPYSIIIGNMNGKVIDCNFLEDNITGYLKEEIIGKKMLDIPMFPKEYLPVVIKDFKTLLKGRIIKPNEIQIHKKDGTLVWVQPTASIFKIEDESYIQIIMQEISERKIKRI